jgi:hypothetical protein
MTIAALPRNSTLRDVSSIRSRSTRKLLFSLVRMETNSGNRRNQPSTPTKSRKQIMAEEGDGRDGDS